jgi:DNA-binding MarR family transcriptional regulator
MPQPIPDLTDHLGYWLRQVSNHVSHAFARRLAAKGVTVAEWALMRVLHGAPPLAPSRIAEVMGLTRGAVTKLADRLIAKSLIVRQASPDDGRAQTLALTATGRDFVPELAALAEDNEAACFDHLPEADRRTLERILKDMVRHLGVTAMPLA